MHLPRLVALNHSPHDTLNHKIGGEEGIVGNHHLPSAGIAPAFCLDCTLGTNCSVTEKVRSGDDPHASGYHRGLESSMGKSIRMCLGFSGHLIPTLGQQELWN